MNPFDVVIIGGGLGGLESGVILSKEGMKVCVLEQHHTLGGNLQTFKRDGCIFDTGMHFFGSMREGEYLFKYFNYFGIADKLNLKQMDPDFELLSFSDGKEYSFQQGYPNFRSGLLNDFPEAKDVIDAYMAGIKEVTDNFPLYKPEKISSFNISHSILQKCAPGFFHSLTDNDRLKNVLAGGITMYPGHADKTPLYIHACSRDSMIQSCWRPIDGSQQIADRLAEEITGNGGVLMTSSRVKEILIDDDVVTAVLLENGEKITGKKFISNAHPVSTLKMIPEGKIRKFYRSRIYNLENSLGAFIIYGVFKENSFPYLNKSYFHYNNAGILHPMGDENTWPDNFYFYTPTTSRSDEFADSFIVLADMSFEEVSKWEGTQVSKRGADYLEFKAEKEEILLQSVEKRFPGIRGHILKTYTSTPLTFQDYTGTHRGSAYGILKDCNEPLKSIILPQTKISNLYFTGQNLNLHGFMGVTAGAVITCSAILGLEYLTNKIVNG
jgi:phytoene dehydrogenase-like protein